MRLGSQSGVHPPSMSDEISLPLFFPTSLHLYLPISLSPYLSTSLPPYLPTSLPPYLPTSLPPSLPPYSTGSFVLTVMKTCPHREDGARATRAAINLLARVKHSRAQTDASTAEGLPAVAKRSPPDSGVASTRGQ